MVTVVSAAIVDAQSRRVLLAQRCGSTSHPWVWCTPGGKVEADETHRAALARELREELDVELTGELGPVLYEREVTSTRTSAVVKVVCYVVQAEAIAGKSAPKDGTIGVGWFGLDTLLWIPMAAADNAERMRFLTLLHSETWS